MKLESNIGWTVKYERLNEAQHDSHTYYLFKNGKLNYEYNKSSEEGEKSIT
jgi:hypothetical protein